MSDSTRKSIFYHNSSGREAYPSTMDAVVERALEGGIKKVVLFSASIESIVSMKERLDPNSIQLIAVSYPYKRQFKKADTPESFIPETSMLEGRTTIQGLGVQLVQGIMPFEEVFLPGGMPGSLSSVLSYSMNLISNGLILCISSIVMACEGGYLEPGEVVISCAADTAIVASACEKRMLYHPKLGLDIQEILCKPKSRLLP